MTFLYNINFLRNQHNFSTTHEPSLTTPELSLLEDAFDKLDRLCLLQTIFNICFSMLRNVKTHTRILLDCPTCDITGRGDLLPNTHQKGTEETFLGLESSSSLQTELGDTL